MPPSEASRTAVLVCQGRAVADGRIGAGRFSDPVAYELLGAEERGLVDRIRAGTPPAGWGARLEYELVKGSGPMMAARTVAVDDAVRAVPVPQVVVVGAGLDSRAWRMPELAGATVFEVDRPASQRDKQDRLAGRVPLAAEVVFVAVDLGFADLDAALAGAGHDRDRPTVWVWEGVVPYLAPADVQATLGRIAARSAPGSRLVVNYQERALRARVMRLVVRAVYRAGGRRSPWSAEPWRSVWSVPEMAAALRGAGFDVAADEQVRAVAAREGIELDRRGDYGRVAVADR